VNRRHFLRTGTAFALASSGARAADAYPSRPVRIISAYAAGGGPDVQLRQIAPGIAAAIGQNVVIENKVGAGGVLAALTLAAAPPDGYTLGMMANTHLVQKVMQPGLKFDPLADYVPICNMASSPTVLAVRAESPYRSAEELAAGVRAAPGAMNYGSGGIGTSAHLAAATFVSLYGLQATHVPLKGSVEIAPSLWREETQFACPIAGTAVPLVKSGRLRALAVTSRQRLAQLPDVPTLHEITHNALAVQESWFGIWAPAKTPADVVARAHAAIVKSLADPAVRASYESAGTLPVPSESPQAYAAYVAAEYRQWAEIVRLARISPA